MGESGHDVAIVTDSTCDLPSALRERHDLTVIPLYVIWGDEQLRDGVDVDHRAFFQRLTQDPVHPRTSQPTPSDFVQAIQGLDAREVLIITLSQALSGTYESACQARQEVDVPVTVVDSFSLSMGLGWQVLAAARAREQGADLHEMVAAARRVREATSILLTVDTLEYLHRGGRIGGAAKLLGSVVQLKPLLAISHTSGRLEAVEKIRTRRRALRRLLEETFQRVDPDRPVRAAVIHGAAPDDADTLVRRIRDRCEPVESYVTSITPVLGVHGGPGVVGIVAYNE